MIKRQNVVVTKRLCRLGVVLNDGRVVADLVLGEYSADFHHARLIALAQAPARPGSREAFARA